jgi:hypothetical protein
MLGCVTPLRAFVKFFRFLTAEEEGVLELVFGQKVQCLEIEIWRLTFNYGPTIF